MRDQRHGMDPHDRSAASVDEGEEWTDARVDARARERRSPATGTSVMAAWDAGKRLLTPLPDPLPVVGRSCRWQARLSSSSFDAAVGRTVGSDGLVAFEG
ncbi:MAG: hypothetical protein AAF813_03075 [Pseudomonadota bacterium]